MDFVHPSGFWHRVPGDSGFEYGSVEDTGIEPLLFHMRTNKGNIRAAALRFAGRPGQCG
jgi:hypothetical protein